MRINIEEISARIKEEIKNYSRDIAVDEVGTVVELGDGIARIYGMRGAMAMEMLEFETGVYGLALNLEEDSIGAVILGDYVHLHEGGKVRRTGRVLQVPVGRELIGRVVNPLGIPIDDKGEIKSVRTRPVEFKAPGIQDRQSVREPLQTGVKSIDAMVPIGRGQRELLIGDRGTGKESLAMDAIINQKGTGVICVYVAIGQKASMVAGIVEALRSRGAMEHTIVVAATAAEPAALQYIAPYAGCAMAEYFMYEEHLDTLCVYDDLSRQANAYRQLALLLRRPPGREAYPGDVFYLHSRLLERAARLSKERGGGSLTALPLIETQEGEVSAYIPTNVISITDGQIYLRADLYNAGIRPAIDVGLSVSRVGGNAQIKAMKQVAGSLRIDLAAYRELEAFAQMGTELDKATQNQLARGARLVETLKQQQYSPMPVEEQVMILYAATRGFMDDVPVARVREFETRFLEYLRSQKPEILAGIRNLGTLSQPEILTEAITAFKKGFEAVAKTREIRKRIGSVRTIRKITHTMERVAQSKSMKLTGRSDAAKSFKADLLRLLPEALGAAPGTLLSTQEIVRHPLGAVRSPVKRVLLFCVTSSRGLCGGYNSRVIQAAEARIAGLVAEGKEPVLAVIGKKGLAYFRYHRREVALPVPDADENVPFARIGEVAQEIIDLYTRKEIDEVEVVSTHLRTRVQQEVRRVPVLPYRPEAAAGAAAAPGPVAAAVPPGPEIGPDGSPVYLVEPNRPDVLAALLPLLVKAGLFCLVLEAMLCEQAQRTLAMRSASDNADAMTKKLTRTYNRARQSQITNEMIEIISGSEGGRS